MSKIGIFPGSFKPPHKGHFMVVEDLLLQCEEVIVLISPKEREGITSQQSIDVWRLYHPQLWGEVKFLIVKENAVTEAYNFLSKYPDHEFVLAFGKDDASRFKAAQNKDKYPNAEVFNAGNNLGFSATIFRKALRERDMETINMYLPNGVNTLEFMEKMNMNLHEQYSVDWWKEELNELFTEDVELEPLHIPNAELTQEFVEFTAKEYGLTNQDFSLNFTVVPLKDTFGHFSPSTKDIKVYWGEERAFADRARTLAHEMYHAYQLKHGLELNGETGSECENNANAHAGIILRKFKDIHPEIFTL